MSTFVSKDGFSLIGRQSGPLGVQSTRQSGGDGSAFGSMYERDAHGDHSSSVQPLPGVGAHAPGLPQETDAEMAESLAPDASDPATSDAAGGEATSVETDEIGALMMPVQPAPQGHHVAKSALVTARPVLPAPSTQAGALIPESGDEALNIPGAPLAKDRPGSDPFADSRSGNAKSGATALAPTLPSSIAPMSDAARPKESLVTDLAKPASAVALASALSDTRSAGPFGGSAGAGVPLAASGPLDVRGPVPDGMWPSAGTAISAAETGQPARMAASSIGSAPFSGMRPDPKLVAEAWEREVPSARLQAERTANTASSSASAAAIASAVPQFGISTMLFNRLTSEYRANLADAALPGIPDMADLTHFPTGTGDIRPGSHPSAAPTVPASAQAVAAQIAQGLVNSAGHRTEVVLDPEELGKVSLRMTTDERSITVFLAAERPETLDLMRRNIGALEQEFRALGYESINFSFNDDRQPAARQDDVASEGRGGGPIIEVPQQEARPRPRPISHGQLDIRL